MRYLDFAVENRRFLAFGFLLTFFSNTGQTYFIALFNQPIRAEFGLTHGDFGGLYSLATLASAATVVWLGRMIDAVDLRVYASAVAVGLVGACFLLAWAPSVVALTGALYLLRLTAHGLMGHTAQTSMGRYFHRHRGKAMSLSATGHPAGEAVFPLFAVALLAGLGWRGAWTAMGAGLAVVLVPAVLWLLRGHHQRHRDHLEETATDGGTGSHGRQWSRRDVLGDPRFYLILPAYLAPTFILTGFFFHQVHLAATKGWSLEWLATCFIAFAVMSLVGSLGSGPLVDRLGAVRLLPYYLMPMAAALVALAVSDHPGAALFYLAAAGLTTGAGSTIVGALWAEMYGTRHLGAIRAMASALMVFSTALAPAALGWAIDGGVTMEAIAVVCLVYVGVGAGLVTALSMRHQPAD